MSGDHARERNNRAAAPLGVRIVILTLLVCGLALAALPLTVLLRGRGASAGHFAVRNDTGAPLTSLRVVRLVGTQQHLLGAAHHIAAGSVVDAAYEPGEALRLSIEIEHDGSRRQIPFALADGAPGTVSIGPHMVARLVP